MCATDLCNKDDDRVWVQHHVLYILLLVVQISANVP